MYLQGTPPLQAVCCKEQSMQVNCQTFIFPTLKIPMLVRENLNVERLREQGKISYMQSHLTGWTLPVFDLCVYFTHNCDRLYVICKLLLFNTKHVHVIGALVVSFKRWTSDRAPVVYSGKRITTTAGNLEALRQV